MREQEYATLEDMQDGSRLIKFTKENISFDEMAAFKAGFKLGLNTHPRKSLLRPSVEEGTV